MSQTAVAPPPTMYASATGANMQPMTQRQAMPQQSFVPQSFIPQHRPAAPMQYQQRQQQPTAATTNRAQQISASFKSSFVPSSDK